MAQRRHHYERAFEEFLRSRRIPYVAVDEARKALLPDGDAGALRVTEIEPAGETKDRADGPGTPPVTRTRSLKSFDFVIYAQPTNLLLDVKGRKVVARARRSTAGGAAGRLENWVTREDIESLTRWEALFGPEFRAAFLFVYWCDAQPPDALFQEVIEYRGWWYALRTVTLADYRQHMRVRSPRWGTLDVKGDVFERISQPFTSAEGGGLGPWGNGLGPPRGEVDAGEWMGRIVTETQADGSRLYHVADPPRV